MQQYKVHNVKVHWKWTSSEEISMPEGATRHSNFFTVRYRHYVYCVFDKNKHINASGIKDFDDIKGAVNAFNVQFHTNIDVNNISVDNTTVSGKLDTELYSVCISKILAEKEKHFANVKIRSRVFPSIIIRPKNKSGTIILFNNNKFIIVGCKSRELVHNTYCLLCVLTQRSLMTFPRQPAFAPNVG